MVWTTLQFDLTKLAKDYIHNYRDGSAVFYVSIINEHGEEEHVTKSDKDAWGPLWNEENKILNALLS